MNNKNIVIAGGGVLGSQIAFQTAYCGYNVTVWSLSEDAKNIAIDKINKLKETYVDTINKMATPEGKTPTVRSGCGTAAGRISHTYPGTHLQHS